MTWLLWLFLSFVSPAQAQCNGSFGPGTVCGNGGASPAPPSPVPLVPVPLPVTTCAGGAGDAATINSLLGANISVSVPQNKTCLFSTPVTGLVNGVIQGQALTGGGWSTLIEPSASITALFDLNNTEQTLGSLTNVYLNNKSSLATEGINYHGFAPNSVFKINNDGFFNFTNGIVCGTTAADDQSIIVSDGLFFNNTGFGIAFNNFCQGASVHTNQFLGNSGVSFNLTTGQPEGVRVYDNTFLPGVAGTQALNIKAGLEFEFFGNIFDQNFIHGVTIDTTSHPVSAMKFVSNWFGAAASVAANQDGLHLVGAPEYIPLIADTFTGWTGYGVNTGTGGVQNLPIIGSKFYSNTIADLQLNNVAGAVLIANRFLSTVSWSESSMASPLVAIGNRCAGSATGVTTSDLILGDGSCNANQIPGPLTVFGQATVTQELNASWNMGGSFPQQNGGLSLGTNFTSGQNEVDFFNTNVGFGADSFRWYQQTGASAATELFSLTTSGFATFVNTAKFSDATTIGSGGITLATGSALKNVSGNLFINGPAAGGDVILGSQTTAVLDIEASTSSARPNTDNFFSFGLANSRWSNMFSALYSFSNGTTADTGISRDSAAVIDFGNGTATDSSATLQMSSFFISGTPKLNVFTTGAGTQTFTNSPCSALTTERWIKVTIAGSTSNFFIPACS